MSSLSIIYSPNRRAIVHGIIGGQMYSTICSTPTYLSLFHQGQKYSPY